MHKVLDLSLYLVLDPIRCGGIEGMVTTTQIAVAAGVTAVQLRAEENYERKDWYRAAVALKQALTASNVPLIINNQVDIALAVDADGVHVGQNDLPPAIVRRLIGPNKLLGLSVSNAAQLSAVPWSTIDYLGIGPVFTTTSKKNAAPPLGVSQFCRLIQGRQCPAVAIGGINATNVSAVIATGIDGVAVISAICGQADILIATQQLRSKITASRPQGGKS